MRENGPNQSDLASWCSLWERELIRAQPPWEALPGRAPGGPGAEPPLPARCPDRAAFGLLCANLRFTAVGSGFFPPVAAKTWAWTDYKYIWCEILAEPLRRSSLHCSAEGNHPSGPPRLCSEPQTRCTVGWVCPQASSAACLQSQRDQTVG